jgi:hypothetical protein
MHSRSRRDAGTRPPIIPNDRARVLQNGQPSSMGSDFANNPAARIGPFCRPWAPRKCARIHAFNVNRRGSIATAWCSRPKLAGAPSWAFHAGIASNPARSRNLRDPLDRGGRHGRKGAFGPRRIAPRAARLRAAILSRKHLIIRYKLSETPATPAGGALKKPTHEPCPPHLEDQASGLRWKQGAGEPVQAPKPPTTSKQRSHRGGSSAGRGHAIESSAYGRRPHVKCSARFAVGNARTHH